MEMALAQVRGIRGSSNPIMSRQQLFKTGIFCDLDWQVADST